MFDSSGVPIDGATFTYRDIQTGLAIVSTFTEVYAGLYTAVATTGLYDIYQNGSKRYDLSPVVHVDSNAIGNVGGTVSYGGGSDGSYVLDGTQATVAGLFTKDSSTHYTLLRDGYFGNLTINSGITFFTNGYRLFVNGALSGTGTIDYSGETGGAGTNAVTVTPGTGGSATANASGYLPGGGQGGAGGTGGVKGVSAAHAGASGGAISCYWGNVGLAQNLVYGGSGGGGTGNGGTNGAATGSAILATYGSMRNTWSAVLCRVFSSTTVYSPVYNQTNGGGGGGNFGATGGSSAGAGGGGGAAGNNGGTIVIVARILSGSLTIQANGGTGGQGGNGGAGVANSSYGGGGGAGGNGGNGGQIFILYGIDSSSNTYNVNGGAGGAGGGAGAAGGTGGGAGSVGGTGQTSTIQGIVQKFII